MTTTGTSRGRRVEPASIGLSAGLRPFGWTLERLNRGEEVTAEVCRAGRGLELALALSWREAARAARPWRVGPTEQALRACRPLYLRSAVLLTARDLRRMRLPADAGFLYVREIGAMLEAGARKLGLVPDLAELLDGAARGERPHVRSTGRRPPGAARRTRAGRGLARPACSLSSTWPSSGSSRAPGSPR